MTSCQPHKYLILQFDDDDFYVPCPNLEYWKRLYNSIPDTSDFRGMHGSDTPEGRELTSSLSNEIFGRDLYAIMNNKELPPWNYQKFCDHIITIFGDSHISVNQICLGLVVDKTIGDASINAKVAANQYVLCSKFIHPIPWVRVTDSDVAKMVTDIRKWLSNLPKETSSHWDIDRYYRHLCSLFGDVLIARDTVVTTDDKYENECYDNIVLMRENFPVIVANRTHIHIAHGTWLPWNQVDSARIQQATKYVTSLMNEMKGVSNEPEKPTPLAKGEWNFLEFLDYVKATVTDYQIIVDKPRMVIYIADNLESPTKVILADATHLASKPNFVWTPWLEVTPEMVTTTLSESRRQLQRAQEKMTLKLENVLFDDGGASKKSILMATNAEVMEWLAKGNGIARVQIASDSAVVSPIISCGENDLDSPINASNLTNTMVRRFGDKEWHYPTYDYLKITPKG